MSETIGYIPLKTSKKQKAEQDSTAKTGKEKTAEGK